jgi:hypothetical protein
LAGIGMSLISKLYARQYDKGVQQLVKWLTFVFEALHNDIKMEEPPSTTNYEASNLPLAFLHFCDLSYRYCFHPGTY